MEEEKIESFLNLEKSCKKVNAYQTFNRSSDSLQLSQRLILSTRNALKEQRSEEPGMRNYTKKGKMIIRVNPAQNEVEPKEVYHESLLFLFSLYQDPSFTSTSDTNHHSLLFKKKIKPNNKTECSGQ